MDYFLGACQEYVSKNKEIIESGLITSYNISFNHNNVLHSLIIDVLFYKYILEYVILI